MGAMPISRENGCATGGQHPEAQQNGQLEGPTGKAREGTQFLNRSCGHWKQEALEGRKPKGVSTAESG